MVRLKLIRDEKIRTTLEDAYGISLEEEKEPFGGDNPDEVHYVLMPEKLQKEFIERFGKGHEDVANLRVKALLLEKMHEKMKKN